MLISFGKNIKSALVRMGSEARELKEYFEKRVAPHFSCVEKREGRRFMDFNANCPESLLEVKYFIRRICEELHFCPSREIINSAAKSLLSRVANRQFMMKKGQLMIDRKRLFVRQQPLTTLFENRPLEIGVLNYGSWVVQVEQGNWKRSDLKSDWKNVWNGEMEVILPHGQYSIGPPKVSSLYPRNKPLGKWWTQHKVPTFLREETPVIWRGNQTAHEFLTGKIKEEIKNSEYTVKITLKVDKKSLLNTNVLCGIISSS